MLKAASALLAASLVAGGCTLFVSTDGLSGGPSSDAGESLDASALDGALDDGSATSQNDGDSNSDASDCPGTTGGPTPVRVGTYCIDSTEVTNAQYIAFLATGVSP